MAAVRYQSWGRFPKIKQEARRLYWRDAPLPTDGLGERGVLPFGNGRSYGDVCLNEGGLVLDCQGLDRFIAFDTETGVLRCEAGVVLADILDVAVPRGWFVPVTPGTQFVTLGGAVANDVHGKNHHRTGTFGRHVRCFELMRTDGTRLFCSPEENADYFAATIGGLGLTGVILWVEIQLQSIKTPYIEQEVIRYQTLDEFFDLAAESEDDFEYSVAWVDCLAKGEALGRGLFMRGNHAQHSERNGRSHGTRHMTFPIDPPISPINGLTLRLFNTLYYHKQRSDRTTAQVHYQSFFYPLDRIRAWNRLYGRRGFFQYQCVLPTADMKDGIKTILERIGEAGDGSFLAVLKLFGDKPSPGLLSFPIPGATLALDFPNKGAKTLRLLDRLDEITRKAGGRLNPSKDARMKPADFQHSYKNWTKMTSFIDPQISSSFWRRVTAQ